MKFFLSLMISALISTSLFAEALTPEQTTALNKQIEDFKKIEKENIMNNLRDFQAQVDEDKAEYVEQIQILQNSSKSIKVKIESKAPSSLSKMGLIKTDFDTRIFPTLDSTNGNDLKRYIHEYFKSLKYPFSNGLSLSVLKFIRANFIGFFICSAFDSTYSKISCEAISTRF